MATRYLLLAFLSVPAGIGAQQVVEVDYSAGRTILDDEWRAINPAEVITDWTHGLLYAQDKEEPNGIMVFSLETGEWIRTIPTPRGDGPFEFSQGRASMALAQDGGLYVSGLLRVVTYDPNGQPVSSWTPRAHMRKAVCDLGGKPTVPVLNGVLRYETETIGPDASSGVTIMAASKEEGMAIARTLLSSRIACTEDRAFVVLTYDEGPDSVFVYHVSGEVGRIAVPTDFAYDDEWKCEIAGRPCPPWSRNLFPSFDDRGNLALFGIDRRTAGTIINPETGCYAIVRKDPLNDGSRIPIRIRGDSAMVFQQDSRERNGRRQVFMGSTNKVSLHPLKRVSGEPCPGLLPSIRRDREQ